MNLAFERKQVDLGVIGQAVLMEVSYDGIWLNAKTWVRFYHVLIWLVQNDFEHWNCTDVIELFFLVKITDDHLRCYLNDILGVICELSFGGSFAAE